MPSEASPSAVLHTHPFGPPDAAAGSFPGGIPRVGPRVGAVVAAGSLGRGLRRVFSVLGDFGAIVAVVYGFALVILAIGLPIALLVRLAMWMVRAL